MAKNRVISNCIVTHQDSEVIREYGWNKKLYSHSMYLSGNDVYCPCCGVVIYSGKLEDKYSVCVQYSENVSLKFNNLSEVSVTLGQVLTDNSYIGKCYKYVDFEYLTTEPNDPNHRVFLPLVSLYTHDPNSILNGYVKFESSDMYYDEDQIVDQVFLDRGFENYE